MPKGFVVVTVQEEERGNQVVNEEQNLGATSADLETGQMPIVRHAKKGAAALSKDDLALSWRYREVPHLCDDPHCPGNHARRVLSQVQAQTGPYYSCCEHEDGLDGHGSSCCIHGD